MAGFSQDDVSCNMQSPQPRRDAMCPQQSGRYGRVTLASPSPRLAAATCWSIFYLHAFMTFPSWLRTCGEGELQTTVLLTECAKRSTPHFETPYVGPSLPIHKSLFQDTTSSEFRLKGGRRKSMLSFLHCDYAYFHISLHSVQDQVKPSCLP